MSQVAGIVTANAGARAAFVARVKPRMPLLPTQATTTWSSGDADVVCAAAPKSPTAHAVRQPAGGTFVLGRWNDDVPAGTCQAIALLEACQNDGGASGMAVARGGGYGVSCYVEPSGTAWMGVDLLGLFPLYYHATADTLLFATSPDLLRAHAPFRPELNVRGLVGNLLTMHMVGEQTLWRDVRRLKPGHALRWTPGRGAEELMVRQVTPGDAHFGESYAQHLDRIDALFDRAVRLDAVEGSTGQLFSGGLDSRLLGAYLRRALNSPVHAITLGIPGDIEMQIARRVARRLGWPLHPVSSELDRFVAMADKHLTHNQLANGFNNLGFWYTAEVAGNLATRVHTGAMGDTVMGGVHIPWGFDPRTQLHTFDTLFARLNRYGYSPAGVRKLLRPEALDGTIDAALSDLRDTFDRCAGLPFQKVWLFDLLHRNRFHIAAMAWEVSAGAWAAVPFTTAAMLDACANMPADTLMDRRVQIDLLCRHARDLAELPLDRNSRTNLAPVWYRSRWHKRWDEKVMNKIRRARRHWEDRRGVDSRYYYRVYDINNAAWRAVREAAEPHRQLAERIFDPAALREAVPPPNVDIKLQDGIVDAARIKTLLGFMLWAGKNL